MIRFAVAHFKTQTSLYFWLPITRTLAESNLPVTRRDVYFLSGHFLYNFILDNSTSDKLNLFLFCPEGLSYRVWTIYIKVLSSFSSIIEWIRKLVFLYQPKRRDLSWNRLTDNKKRKMQWKVQIYFPFKRWFSLATESESSRNQKRRAIRSIENQTDGVGSRALILLMTPSLMIKWKLHCRSRKQKRKNKPMTMFDSGPCDWLVLPLLLPTPTTQFPLDRKRWSRKRNRRKWKRSYSSDSDSVELMTLLTTTIFDFH